MRLNLLAFFLLLVLIFLQYRLWSGSGSIQALLGMKKALTVQIEENEKLKKRNEALLFQVDRLKHSQNAAESRARYELGMIKKGEIFYQIVRP